MHSYLTILAATFATATAQYGGSSQMSNNYQQPPQQMKSSNSYQPPQQNSYSGSSMMSSGSSMMSPPWMGWQQSSNMNQAGGMVIAMNNGGSGSMWKQVSSSSNMYTGSMSSSPMTHQVTVGGSAGLVYTPNTIMASPGDYVQFNFQSENHTVTQSSFNTPCVKMMGGMDSGFTPNKNNATNPAPAFKIQVTSSMPMWFYCRQKTPEVHCGKGMTFSINPTPQKTQQMFMQMAIQQNGTMSSSSGSMQNNNSPPPAVATPQSTVVQGSGSMNNGECQCNCLCGSNAYASGLGIGMMNGISGMMPMSPAPAK